MMEYGILLLVGAAVLVPLLAYGLSKPQAVTLVVIFVLYSNLAVVAKRVHNVPEIVAASFFLLLVIPLVTYIVLRGRPVVVNNIMLWMVGYLGLLLASALFSRDPAHSMPRIIIYVLEGMVLYFLIINTIRSTEVLRRVVWTLLIAGSVMGSTCLYQEMTGNYDKNFGGLAQVKKAEITVGDEDEGEEETSRRRLAGTIGSKNRFAQALVVLLPLAVSRFRAERLVKLRLAAALCCVPIMSGALLTFSRGAGLAIMGTLVAMMLLRVIKVRDGVLIAVAGLLIVVVCVPQYIYRMGTVFDDAGKVASSGSFSGAGGSVRGRATVNRATWLIFADHPLLGVGPGQTHLHTRDYGNTGGFRALTGSRRAHNMYLEELADTGLLGFLGLMSIVGITIWQLLQLHRRFERTRPDQAHMAAGLALAIVAYLGTAVFLHLSYIRYFWVLLAIGGAGIRILTAERSAQPVPARSKSQTKATVALAEG